MQENNRVYNLVFGMYLHYKKRWPAYVITAFVLVLFGSNYKIAVNVTDSLPGYVYLVEKGTLPTRANEPVAFRWRDEAKITQYPDGVTFLKLVAGLPGDSVVKESELIITNEWRLKPKQFSRTNKKLESNAFTGTIPDGKFFVAGIHADSLDSRYALVGLVSKDDIIGRAYEIF
jgi:conjugal transfer pilin signal peptidase TrbI